jgi:hypothetical protein
MLWHVEADYNHLIRKHYSKFFVNQLDLSQNSQLLARLQKSKRRSEAEETTRILITLGKSALGLELRLPLHSLGSHFASKPLPIAKQ